MRARSEEAKDERRQALLKAALDEFVEKGFAAARMNDIAERAGLSKGAIYLYFESKHALFAALIESVALPNIERVEALAEAAPSATDAIRALASAAPSILRETPIPLMIKVIIADARVFPDIVIAHRRQVVDRALGLIAGILERGRDAGEFVVEDPTLFARLVAAPLVLSAIWRVVFETGPAAEPEARVDLDALFALHQKALLRALRPGGEDAE